MTDSFTDELFPVTQVEAGRVIIPVSRLVCDVERFPLDEQEPMVARGMGVVFTRTSMGDALRACAQCVRSSKSLGSVVLAASFNAGAVGERCSWSRDLPECGLP